MKRRAFLLACVSLLVACGDDMAALLIAQQTTPNPIVAPAFTAPAAGATLEVAQTQPITVTCDVSCTRVDVLLATGELLGSVTPVAGSATFNWSPGQLRAGAQTLVVRTYRGTSYAQVSRNVTVSGTPLASLWDVGYWHADDLAMLYSDGASVTSWVPRSGSGTWAVAGSSPTTPTPTYQTATGGNGWPGNQGKGCLLFNGTQGFDMACPAAFTGTNRRTVLLVYMHTAAGGTQTLICASATAAGTNKWQLFSTPPGAFKVLRGATISTFGTASDLRDDAGPGHFVCVQDPGTAASAIGLARDTLWQSVQQSSANAAASSGNPTRLALGFNYNGTTTPTNFGSYKLLAVAIGTQAVTDAQIQKTAWQALGLYDADQYYGDSTTAWKLNPISWQSNAQGLAVSALTALPLIRFLAISTNNWIADMTRTVAIGPQQGDLGPWYQFAQDRRTATGVDVHVCLMGQGATGANSFKAPTYDGLYSVGLFDLQCRVIQEMKCLMGGNPTMDRYLLVGGESDAQSAGGSSTVQANVTTWVANLRALVPGCNAGTRFVWPQVNSFSGYPFGAAVQAAAVAWAGADVNGAAPSTAALASAGFFNVDAIHYNQAGALALGSILAAA